MDLTKITFFLALVAASYCDDKDKTEYLGDDKDFDDTPVAKTDYVSPSRRIWGPPTTKENCICLPTKPGLLPVTNYLTGVSNSDELRLVVYFFKNSVTGKIRVYVPNDAKQRAFPDVSFEVDEILGPFTDTSTLTDIFTRSIWITVKQHVYHQPTTSRPVYQIPESKDRIIIPDIIDHLSRERPFILTYILGNLQRFQEAKQILETLTGVTLKDKLLQLKMLHPVIYAQFIQKITELYPMWLIDGTMMRYNPDQLNTFPYTIKLLPLLNGKRVIINAQLQPQRTVKEIIVYTPRPTRIVHELHPIYMNTNPLFNEWLEILVNGLNNYLKFASKVIDVVLFKSFMLDALQTNALSVSIDGDVVDSYGRKIQLSNIIVRPVLIGESSLIYRVISNGLFRVPSGIIFLEALFISGSTTKSLGIIPIDHIVTGFQESRATVQVVESIKTCANNVCQVKKICKNVYGQEKPCLNLSLGSGDAETSEFRTGNKKCKFCKGKQGKVNDSNPPTETANKPLNIVMDKSGNEISTAVETAKSSDPAYDTYPYSIPDDEEPGIRIVGGSAATNSGTPVSARG